MQPQRITVDGNEAAARIAHLTNEVIAIYPITPASPMGEFCDLWSSRGQKNLWGMVPRVIEMQSEGGAAGAVHGSLQAGALTTTFTASQGLLLMLPNMFKIAGELTPAVIHVAARAVATHALSIFGDHSDVMAARSTGWALLCSSSVQEAHDFAMISQMATLRSRVPFVHFFDGFRTSHELNQIYAVGEDDVRALLPNQAIEEFRARALNPDRPVLRGSAQNPDVFFQAREACEPYYAATSRIVADCMAEFAEKTGRKYQPFDYVGAEDAESVLVLMGSGVHAVEEAVEELNAQGAKVGCIKVRLYRPFDVEAFRAALPSSVRSIAVLDRTKEPGSVGEPLYQDVVTALHQTQNGTPLPSVKGGRYGLGQKEFTPAMAAAALRAAADDSVRHSFTVGIEDDVSKSSLTVEELALRRNEELTQALFYGLGSDGTVGATKSSVKIIAKDPKSWAQGYFVYDSKKSGSVTVSHLRFGKKPVVSSYEIDRADFVACHQFSFLERIDVLERAASGATVLLNSPYSASEVWEHLPHSFQESLLKGGHRMYVIDADQVAEDAGLGRRINTVMQTCFFTLSGLLNHDEAIAAVKASIEQAYGRMGQSVVDRNQAAVEAALDALEEVDLQKRRAEGPVIPALVPDSAPELVRELTAPLMAGLGDTLPVSALPIDGTFPTGTARWEKRSIAREIPIWDADVCIQCGLCAMVCPHASIRVKAFPKEAASDVTPWREGRGKELAGEAVTIQVAPDDCTGCRVCVDVCPAFMKENVSHKAINMAPQIDHLEQERERWEAFLKLPESDRTQVETNSIKGSQRLQPLFEFSGACAGCGETPYLKLLSQLFGDRTVIANATGCSSIYGGNLPTTPWTTNAEGRGPAWSNSLFEDNAEFGLGMRLALDQQRELAEGLLREFREEIGAELADVLLEDIPTDEASLATRREQIERLKAALKDTEDSRALALLGVSESLLPRSVWIVGGDGWAYDIGFGGLDHVLASGLDVNILVLDTEVYSNTGGQASKATPLGAVAKFASGGKEVTKKDLGMLASAYGNVYVAQIAMGANPSQTVKAFHEAESHHGPSLLIAYSSCIAHGIDMSQSMARQKEAAKAGVWPLYRFDPRRTETGEPPLQLDSRKPKIPFREYAMKEARFAMLYRQDREESQRLMKMAQEGIDQRWHLYEQLAKVDRSAATEEEEK